MRKRRREERRKTRRDGKRERGKGGRTEGIVRDVGGDGKVG